ncbi:hypothetical protein QBC34DRAFT_313343 [Podospora aff. communis PSN243]|uniref:CMP/dCMP-type deaminase domain-containing protein n=1 Tax=Podospora aff. communis PSN243 TaxID=3040156 RepID=A0AAV9G152_9PEZI|nr:hypothetical protein QBC34DRAFT_313343 [Podospora aff. communis PSN243]
MKTDKYLNLCLEQAARSPLHYRHGSIVVKGGKVVGLGFNDNRSGYDGGALKTGRLPTASFPLDNAAASKRKPNSKLPDPPTTSTFIPFERSRRGGHHANTCFSMHSEMMAINSALAASSTLAASTASSLKPYFKLSRRHTKRSLLRDAVKSYVKRVCLDAMGPEFKQQARQNTLQGATRTVSQSHASSHIQKHTRTKLAVGKVSRSSNGCLAALTPAQQHVVAPAQNHVLLPKGRARQTSRASLGRMKRPKIVGADVYVARLAKRSPSLVQRPAGSASLSRSVSDDVPLSPASASTGSLHDELTCKTLTRAPVPLATCPPVRTALDSRPCYRCVCYMHSVGIKRVFWTNGEGKWEGAKVRDLVDMLEGSGPGSEGDAVSGLGVFVTKHEVLMLRRMWRS